MSHHFIENSDIIMKFKDGKTKVGGENSNFSEYFDLKRIAAHYFRIPPGSRTSRPHAESMEEEFLYVISGEIDLWLNGNIKNMKTGECIGFPPGSGVAHCFINNSSQDCELFVSGDRTKSNNQCHFPLEQNLKDELGDFWWDLCPKQSLGPHNALPGEVLESERDEEIKVLNALESFTDKTFSYPGDDETFADGICMSREFGLKSVAIWLERIPPGKRTSWPHAHSTEEEFVYVLKGEVTVLLDDKTYKKGAGTAIDFKAGSGVAHTLMNESESEVLYICVGECEPIEDKIYYPLHPKRNEEIRLKGYLWEDRPDKQES